MEQTLTLAVVQANPNILHELHKIPRWLLLFPEAEQDHVAVLDDEYNNLLAREYEHWKYVELPKVRKGIAEWREEMKPFADECRKRYLASQLEELQAQEVKMKKQFFNGTLNEKGRMVYRQTQKKLFSLGKSIDVLEGRAKGITDDMILRAREYPLDRLLEINPQGFALCINHTDKKPSMYCRKGFVHCFSCQYHGDPIDVYQKMHGCGFPEAVTFLAGGI